MKTTTQTFPQQTTPAQLRTFCEVFACSVAYQGARSSAFVAKSNRPIPLFEAIAPAGFRQVGE